MTTPETLPDRIAEPVPAAVHHVGGTGPGRGRARRDHAERLSADRIVEVAIEQMREHGYDAVTMRSIARELRTGPASLYAHVASRAALDQLVVGRICAQWEVPEPDPGHWDSQLRASLIDLLDLYRAHPGVARCTLGMIPVDPGLLMVTERLIALLEAGGVSDQQTAWFVHVASLYVASVAVEEDIWRARGGHQAPTGSGDERFAFGVDLLIGGLKVLGT